MSVQLTKNTIVPEALVVVERFLGIIDLRESQVPGSS